MTLTEQEYLELVRADPKGKWEFDCGRVRSKPLMTWAHDRIAWRVGFRIQEQLGLEEYEVRVDAGRIARPPTRYFIPDAMVIPVEMARRLFPDGNMLALLPEPLPFVLEVWSPSTGADDFRKKLPVYQGRGDAEIWFIHPRERVLRRWVRQPDGSYAASEHRGGVVRLVVLPRVEIDLDELFGLAQ